MRRAAFAAGAIAAFAGAHEKAVAGTAGVPVLMYHAVNDTSPHNAIARSLTLPAATFEKQLRYLDRHGIRTLTSVQLVDALKRGEKPHGVVLTFDDGYADAARVIVPLLRRYHARATFFVNSGSIGSPNHLTWADLRAMHREGMEIGAHGAHHLDLSTLDRAGQQHEIGLCVEKIERYAGARPVSYAYASGQYDRVTLQVLRANRLEAAYTEHYGVVRDLHSPFELPRLRVARDTDLARFAAMAGG